MRKANKCRQEVFGTRLAICRSIKGEPTKHTSHTTTIASVTDIVTFGSTTVETDVTRC